MSSIAIDGLHTFGRTVRLGFRTIGLVAAGAISGRFPVREGLTQGWFFVSVCVWPAILLSVPFGVVIAVQVGSITKDLGATSLVGAVGGMGVMQQAAPMAAALLVGGAGASAIASDLAARTVREEIDAMRIMGVDPGLRLIAPRVVAMTIVAPMLAVVVILMSVLASFLVAIMGQGVASGSYWSAFGSFASVTDLSICIAKAALFGFLVAVIAGQRGLDARGGPKGVATSVNAAVVIGVLTCMIANLIITQLITMFIPPRFF